MIASPLPATRPSTGPLSRSSVNLGDLAGNPIKAVSESAFLGVIVAD